EVRRQLDLVAAVGFRTDDERMTLRIPTAARRSVRARLEAEGLVEGRPWVVIHPGSTAPSRRYPPESFAEVARRLVEDHGLRVVFTGEPGEREEIDRIRMMMAGAPSLSMAGDLSLPALAALLPPPPLPLSHTTRPLP